MFSFFKDIFLEPSRCPSPGVFIPKDLTDHYRTEIQELPVEQIMVYGPYAWIEEKIFSYKYRSHREYALEFAQQYHQMIEATWLKKEDSIIIFPPMHFSRYCIRGFDHMKYIGKILSKHYGYSVVYPFWVKFSLRQAHLSKSLRRESSRIKFFLKQRVPWGKNRIFIDDIISSGYTLFSLSKILHEDSSDPIFAFFIASNSYPCQNI